MINGGGPRSSGTARRRSGGGRPLPSRSSTTNDDQTAQATGAHRDGANPIATGLAAVKSFSQSNLCRSSCGAPRRTGPFPTRVEPVGVLLVACPPVRRECSPGIDGPAARTIRSSLAAAIGNHAVRDGAKPTPMTAVVDMSLVQNDLHRSTAGAPRRTGPIPTHTIGVVPVARLPVLREGVTDTGGQVTSGTRPGIDQVGAASTCGAHRDGTKPRPARVIDEKSLPQLDLRRSAVGAAGAHRAALDPRTSGAPGMARPNPPARMAERGPLRRPNPPVRLAAGG